MNKVHTFKIGIDWKLISEISILDRFDALWISIEKERRTKFKTVEICS